MLRRAVDVARGCGKVQDAEVLEALIAALRKNRDGAREDGTSPLFDLSHGPLARLLAKYDLTSVPGEVVFTGAGVRITLPVVRFVRRLEREGGAQAPAPGRLFNWSPKGNAWLHTGQARGRNGAGVRTLSHSWKDWVCAVPGPYAAEGVLNGWQAWWDGANVAVLDPGLLLPVCLADGRALSKEAWHRARAVWADFVPKPKAVHEAEVGLAKTGGQARHPGVVTFSKYVAGFHKAWAGLTSYYGSPTKAAAREYKGDKQRSLLDKLLRAVAPNPQVGACTGARWAIVLPRAAHCSPCTHCHPAGLLHTRTPSWCPHLHP